MAQCHAQQGNSLSDKVGTKIAEQINSKMGPDKKFCFNGHIKSFLSQIFKKKTLNMSHSPLSTYSLGWIKDTTIYSETLIDIIPLSVPN